MKMAWTDGNLASALTELEAAERRLEAGEQPRPEAGRAARIQ